jgi:hypothetical protein
MEELPSNLIERLRSYMPVPTMLLLKRPLTMVEAKQVADRQIEKLAQLLGDQGPRVDIERIAELDEIRVEFLPPGELSRLHGASDWVNGQWVISLNEQDDLWDARFTVAHEFKHILDAPFGELLYPDKQAAEQGEPVCDYFAGSLLVREQLLRQAWARYARDVSQLAGMFQVTEQLIHTRLRETGLITPWPGVDGHHYTRVKVPHVRGWQDAGRRYLLREHAAFAARIPRSVRPPSQTKARRLQPFQPSAFLESIDYFITGLDHYPNGGRP